MISDRHRMSKSEGIKTKIQERYLMAGLTTRQIDLSQDLFKRIDKKAGVYFISPDFSDTEKFLVKIGIAGNSKDGNLRGRFNNYLLCWPQGFHVYGLFFTNTKQDAMKMERAIHQYLNAKEKHFIAPHSHEEEWYTLTLEEIKHLRRMVEANHMTLYPEDFELAGTRIFPYREPVDLEPFTESGKLYPNIIANLTVGQARIKPMAKELVWLLDEALPTKGIHTSLKKPKKSTKKNPKGRTKIPMQAL